MSKSRRLMSYHADATMRELIVPATTQALVVVRIALLPDGNIHRCPCGIRLASIPPFVPNGMRVWIGADAAPAPEAIHPMNCEVEVVNVAATMTIADPAPPDATMRVHPAADVDKSM